MATVSFPIHCAVFPPRPERPITSPKLSLKRKRGTLWKLPSFSYHGCRSRRVARRREGGRKGDTKEYKSVSLLFSLLFLAAAPIQSNSSFLPLKADSAPEWSSSSFPPPLSMLPPPPDRITPFYPPPSSVGHSRQAEQRFHKTFSESDQIRRCFGAADILKGFFQVPSM